MALNEQLYDMIFKRRSFHVLRRLGPGCVTEEELRQIGEIWQTLTPLCPDIRTAIRIVPAGETSCRRGAEYCILFYSEEKTNYLQNIGYLGEQLDLYLVSRNIGTLWFGLGQTEEAQYDGLNFVIMMAISKVEDDSKFRKDLYKSKRKPVEDLWHGEPMAGVTDLARFAPSACNTQPWIVERTEEGLRVIRYRKPGKWGIMPAEVVPYYNRIDMGIFLCFLDLCLQRQGVDYEVTLYPDEGGDGEQTLAAVYRFR